MLIHHSCTATKVAAVAASMGGGNASLKAAAPGAATISPLGSGSLEDPICAWIQKDSQEQHEERFTELPIHGICHLWPALLEVDHGRRARASELI
jgi:hypothetical protein